jgi:pilus assembly protein Flp/PilA
MTTVARFLADEAGVTSVKYGLIAACISLAIVTVIQGVAPKVRDARSCDAIAQAIRQRIRPIDKI